MRAARIFPAILFMSVLVVSVGAFQLPKAHALRCQIDVKGVDYPSAVELSQTFDVTTHLTVTCTTSMVYIGGRVDVIEHDTNTTLSTTGFQVGYVSEPEKTFDIAVLNDAKAPAENRDWMLRAHVTLYAVQSPIAFADRVFGLRVGSGGGMPLWLPVLVVALVVVGILVYVTRIRGRGKRRKR